MFTFLDILPALILPRPRCHATWGSNDCHPCGPGEVDWFGVEQGDGATGPGTERLWITILRANSLFAKNFARDNYRSPSKCGKRFASLAQDCNAHRFVSKKQKGAFNPYSQQPQYFISLPWMLPHADGPGARWSISHSCGARSGSFFLCFFGALFPKKGREARENPAMALSLPYSRWRSFGVFMIIYLMFVVARFFHSLFVSSQCWLG